MGARVRENMCYIWFREKFTGQRENNDLAGQKKITLHSGEGSRLPWAILSTRRHIGVSLASLRPAWSSLTQRYELIWKADVCHRL